MRLRSPTFPPTRGGDPNSGSRNRAIRLRWRTVTCGQVSTPAFSTLRPTVTDALDAPLRLGPIARALACFGVPYAAVGGVAVSAFVPDRQPADFDIVVAATRLADRRMLRALKYLLRRWGLASDASGFVMSDCSMSQQVELIAPLAIGKLHVLGNQIPVSIDVPTLIARRHWRIIGRSPVAVCALSHLIELKRVNGSDRDLRDLALLTPIPSRSDR